jgi:ribosomal protein S18 acetylase RimI-like enzyme
MSTRKGAVPVGFRTATVADIDSVVRLAMTLGRQHQQHDPVRFPIDEHATKGSLEATYRTFFVKQLSNPDATVLLAEVEGRIVGYAFMRLETASFLDLSPAAGWVHDLCIEESARHAGIGEALLREAITILRTSGALPVMLSVAPWNTRARRLFASLGFRETMIECALDDAVALPPRASTATNS